MSKKLRGSTEIEEHSVVYNFMVLEEEDAKEIKKKSTRELVDS